MAGFSVADAAFPRPSRDRARMRRFGTRSATDAGKDDDDDNEDFTNSLPIKRAGFTITDNA